jgi:hypothetical protein
MKQHFKELLDLSLEMVRLTIKVFEENRLTNTQEYIQFQDKLNEYSIK